MIEFGTIRGPIDARFWLKVDKTNACWLWRGALDTQGYGQVRRYGKNHRVHRLIYEQLVGPIKNGLTIDHLCRVRVCVNPAHMEPVTKKENNLRGESPWAKNARKTHCKHGHEFTPENTYFDSEGSRICRTCTLERNRLAYAKSQGHIVLTRDEAEDLRAYTPNPRLRALLDERIGDK